MRAFCSSLARSALSSSISASLSPASSRRLNGVAQEEGRDYRIDGRRTLVFDRELKTEGKLGFWRWLSLSVGIAGTYRQNDSVDVAYRRGGKPVVASRLPLEPL